MKLHRFYVADVELVNDLTIDNRTYTHQWTKVLRFRVGRELALFNEQGLEFVYEITMIDKFGVRLQRLRKVESLSAKKEFHLCFSLLKKDKNDWILQKATELGVTHFVPLLCDRTEKTGFDAERARKIVIEASEQCGRVDIPKIHEPIVPEKQIEEFQGGSLEFDVFVAEQGDPKISNIKYQISQNSVAVLIGPEGGWTDKEKQLFADKKIKNLSLSEFTLRAETAAITAVALLQ